MKNICEGIMLAHYRESIRKARRLGMPLEALLTAMTDGIYVRPLQGTGPELHVDVLVDGKNKLFIFVQKLPENYGLGRVFSAYRKSFGIKEGWKKR